jgi:hypothetical protein
MARRRRTIKIARQPQAKKPSPKQTLAFIQSIILTQIGADDNMSPMLKAMVDDLGADADDVELAQDIALLALDVMDAIADAVEAGDPRRVIFSLMGIIGPAIPEIEDDIKAIQG